MISKHGKLRSIEPQLEESERLGWIDDGFHRGICEVLAD